MIPELIFPEFCVFDRA